MLISLCRGEERRTPNVPNCYWEMKNWVWSVVLALLITVLGFLGSNRVENRRKKGVSWVWLCFSTSRPCLDV